MTLPQDSEVQRTWVMNLLQVAQQRKFYGTLVIKMEHGVIRRVVKEESLLPPGAPVGGG